MFESNQLNRRNASRQKWFKIGLGTMTGILILPVALILGTLIYKGAPVISFEFLFTGPTNGMTAGGIFPALLGTVLLVVVALLASVPLGVAAAIYLSEYAPDNWFTRLINLCIINLAGVPSIVHALFGVGAFFLRRQGYVGGDDRRDENSERGGKVVLGRLLHVYGARGQSAGGWQRAGVFAGGKGNPSGGGRSSGPHWKYRCRTGLPPGYPAALR